MADHSTIDRVKNAGERYVEASESVTSSWRSYCGCQEPGLKIKCLTCPYFIERIQQLQSVIDPKGKADLAVLSPTELSPPYSEITAATGIPRSMVRKFARKAKASRKRYRPTPTYSMDFKQECFDLLAEGLKPSLVAERKGVAADTIRRWHKRYREQQQKELGD